MLEVDSVITVEEVVVALGVVSEGVVLFFVVIWVVAGKGKLITLCVEI